MHILQDRLCLQQEEITDDNTAAVYEKKSSAMLSHSVGYVSFDQQQYNAMMVYTESLVQCRDTFWVESFNHQLLTYLPKRVYFGSATFHMRMDLAVLNWMGIHVYSFINFKLSDIHFPSRSECARLLGDSRMPLPRTPKSPGEEDQSLCLSSLGSVCLQEHSGYSVGII